MDEGHFDEDAMINDYVEDYDEPPQDDLDAMMLEEFDAIPPDNKTNPTHSVPPVNHKPDDHLPILNTPNARSDYRHFETQNEFENTQEPLIHQRNDDALFSFER